MLLLTGINVNTILAVEKLKTDSIYKSTSKPNRIKKLLFYPINDIDNQLEREFANKFLSKHTIGGIIIKKGNFDEVRKWIKVIKKTSKRPPLFVLNPVDILKFPLSGIPNYPNVAQMELLSNRHLIESLGKVYGELAINSGFDILMIDPSKYDSTMNYKSQNKKWIEDYLIGIENSGITVIFGSNNESTLVESKFHLNSINSIFDGITLNKVDEELLPINKKARKSSKFKGLFFEHISNLKDKNQAFDQGNDLLIMPSDANKSNQYIEYLTTNYKIGNSKIKQKFNRYIHFKNKSRLKQKSKTSLTGLNNRLSKLLQDVLIESVVCLKNENEILPIKNLDVSNFASLSGVTSEDQIFRDYLDKYTKVAHYDFDFILNQQNNGISVLSHFDKIIVNIVEDTNDLMNVTELLKTLKDNSDIIVIYQGSRSEINKFLDADALIWTPEKIKALDQLIPQNLFGAINTSGQFPYLNDHNIQSIKLNRTNRIAYSYPEYLDVDSETLNKIDVLVSDAISTYTMPGSQVMMIKNGTVVYDKSFGFATYDSLLKIDNYSLYDIASITKVIATLPALMFLDQENKIHINDPLGEHLGIYKDSDKSDITIKNLLRHQSGLRSYIPFWRKAEIDHGEDFKYKFSNKKRYNKASLDQNIDWNDSIQYWINKSTFNSLLKPDNSYGYLYSDLGFMVLQDLAEEKLNQSMADFLTQNIYSPLGMYSTTFEPLCHFPINMIVPTEQDNYFRKELIWGKVHDQNAALTNGKSGHAGLFSSANDLGKYLQMHLQNGLYGGQKYFSSKVIEEFTTKTMDSKRRALGWDKPNKRVGNVSKYASEKSYGHTGFTGTMVWVDPKYQFIYIFLSNRVYPDSKNNKLSQNNIRTKIQDIMYESFLKTNFE